MNLFFFIIFIILLGIFILIIKIKNNKQPLIRDFFYIQNCLPSSIFDELSTEIQRYNNALENSKEILPNVNRFNYKLPNNKNILKIIKEIKNIIQEKTGLKDLKLFEPTGIEYRKYQKGSWMDWHQDIILTDPPQYECVFTIFNNSDSVTEFQTENGLKKIKSEPNSLIILKAGTILHQVTKTTKGERYFLKFALRE